MILSVDDGCQSDLRVAELANKYGVKTVFYWPVEWHSLAYEKGYEPLSFADAWQIATEFEIGSHTITHRHLTKIPLADACYEILYSKEMLENLFGTEIFRFAAPRGYMTEELTEFAEEIYRSQRLTKGDGLVHVHPNSGANDNEHWRFKALTTPVKELWCHSWELDKYNLWDELEEFLSEYSSS